MKDFTTLNRLSDPAAEWVHSRQDAVVAMGKAMIIHGLSEPVRAHLQGTGPYALIVLVPTKEHVPIVVAGLEDMLNDNDVVVGLGRSATTTDANELNKALFDSVVSVAVCTAESAVPTSFRALADDTVSLPAHNVATLRRTLREVYGKAPPAFPKGFVVAPNPQMICRCIIPSLPVKKVIDALGKLARSPSPDVGDHLPSLEDCVEFGDARIWGLNVIAELEAWRAGRMHASDLDSGCLLVGPPGTGKTMFARTMASTMGVPLIEMTAGALYTKDGHLGDVVQQMRKFFADASNAGNAVLLIDEVDSFSRRDIADNNKGFNDTVVNELLTQLDGASGRHPGLVVIGCTNLPQNVEPALMRPGRLSRTIEMGPPDSEGIEHILRTHLRGDLADEPLDGVVAYASGLSPAQLGDAVRSARRSARIEGRELRVADIAFVFGVSDGVVPFLPDRVAVHEAGHAMACLLLEHAPVLEAVSVLRRGAALGYVTASQQPGTTTRIRMEHGVMMLLAGRAAEDVVFGIENRGDGAASDLRQATHMVASMHGHLGLGTNLTHVSDLDRRLLCDYDFSAVVEEELQDLYRRIYQLLELHSFHLMALSTELAVRKVMNGWEALHVLEQAELLLSEMDEAEERRAEGAVVH